MGRTLASSLIPTQHRLTLHAAISVLFGSCSRLPLDAMKSFLVLCFMAFATLATASDELRRRRLGGICGFPSKHGLMPPSRFTSRSAYDNYVCKENCNYNQRVCIFHTPNCGRPNLGDRERAMLSKCDSTKRSCASRCRYRRRLMAFEDELIDEQ